MGRISIPPPKETTTNHFSHEHPLNLINHQPQQTVNASPSCAGCQLKPSGLIYSCTTCAYFLHKKCFELPKKITHPCHKEHFFSLLPQPAYPDGLFICNACGELGSGFSYHCKPCGVDLHILCSVMPLSITHAFHAHKLELTFESPYVTKDFCCDICKNNGANHWLYRCNACGFDAHLNCATGDQPLIQQQNPTNFRGLRSPGSLPATSSRSAPQLPAQLHFTAATPYPMQQNTFLPPIGNAPTTGFPAAAQYSPQFGVSTKELTVQAIQQMINNNNALTQAILQATRSGGIGDNRGLQQLMRLMTGLNNGVIGVIGGFPGMTTFGGGVEQEFLQALMNGGGTGIGGGGTDFMSLLGGGNGLDFLEGGGSDFLSGLFGGFSF